MKQYERPGSYTNEVPCSRHPDAPHGFCRSSSHSNNRYTCECEAWMYEHGLRWTDTEYKEEEDE